MAYKQEQRTYREEDFTFTEAPVLSGHRVLLLAGKAWTEMVKDGVIDESTIPFQYHSKVLAYHLGGKTGPVVAFILWSKHHENTVWIDCSYTVPEFRNNGLHNALFKKLKAKCVAEGYTSISSGTHITNKRMQDVYKAQGRVARSITYDYDITDTDREVLAVPAPSK